VDEADVGAVFEEVLQRNYDPEIDNSNANEVWRSMSNIAAAFNRGELSGEHQLITHPSPLTVLL